MTAETDIAAVNDGGANTAAEVRTALTSVLARGGGVTARVSLTTNEALNNSSLTLIPWDQADWDDGSYWAAGSPTLLTVPAAGVYRVTFAWFLTAATSTPNIRIDHGVSGVYSQVAWDIPGGGSWRANQSVAIVEAAAGDTIRVGITVFAAGISLTADPASWLAIEQIRTL